MYARALAGRIRRPMVWSAGVALLYLLLATPGAAQVPVAPGEWKLILPSLMPQQWHDAQGHSVDDLKGASSQGLVGVAGCWTGAAFDSDKYEYLFLGAGGHACTGDNSVFAGSLKTYIWIRQRDPGPIAEIPVYPSGPPPPAPQYSDGSVATQHTYNGLRYMPSVKRVLNAACSGYWPGSEPARYIYEYDPTAAAWLKDAEPCAIQGNFMVGGNGAMRTAWDSKRSRVLLHSDGTLYAYDPARALGQRVSQISPDGLPHAQGDLDYQAALYDSGRDWFVQMGAVKVDGTFGFSYYPLAGSPPARTDLTLVNPDGSPFAFPTYAANGVSVYRAGGVWYIKRLKAYGIWKGAALAAGGDNAATIYLVTPKDDGSNIATVTTETANKGKPSFAPGTGVYSKLQGLEDGEVIVVMNATSEGLWAYRLGGSSAPPAPPAPGARTWTEWPNPGPGYMPSTGGKHGRTVYHAPSKSMIFGGGDWWTSQPQYSGPYNAGTGSEIWSLNVATGSWTLLRPFCVPGAVQPGRPDTVGFAYDSKRDRVINTPGFYFITQGFDPVALPNGASNCGAIEGWGSYVFDMKTKTWLGPDATGWMYQGATRIEVTAPNPAMGIPSPPGGWGGDTGSSFSVYNPVTDELLRVYGGTTFQRLNLTTGVWSQANLTNGDPNWNPIANRAQSVLDVAKQALYFLDTQSRALVQVMLSTNLVTMIPLPSQYVAPAGDQDVYLVFDSLRREIFVPSSMNHGSTPMLGLGLYKVDAGTWTWEDVPPNVYGSVWGFDEATGSVIGIGKRTASGTVTAYYLYGTLSGNLPPPPPPPPPSPVTIPGVFLGVTGEDKVGPTQQPVPNGIPDWHVRLTGAASDPVSVNIDSFLSGSLIGRWNAPVQPNNWLLAKQFAAGTLDLWIEPYLAPDTFTVTVIYADGTSAAANVPFTRTPPPPPPPSAFKLGDRVYTTALLNVRATPAVPSVILGTQPKGASGAIIGGPVTASGQTWWKLDYAAGVNGWSSEAFLTTVAPALLIDLQLSAGDVSLTRRPAKTGATPQLTVDPDSTVRVNGKVMP